MKLFNVFLVFPGGDSSGQQVRTICHNRQDFLDLSQNNDNENSQCGEFSRGLDPSNLVNCVGNGVDTDGLVTSNGVDTDWLVTSNGVDTDGLVTDNGFDLGRCDIHMNDDTPPDINDGVDVGTDPCISRVMGTGFHVDSGAVSTTGLNPDEDYTTDVVMGTDVGFIMPEAVVGGADQSRNVDIYGKSYPNNEQTDMLPDKSRLFQADINAVSPRYR